MVTLPALLGSIWRRLSFPIDKFFQILNGLKPRRNVYSKSAKIHRLLTSLRLPSATPSNGRGRTSTILDRTSNKNVLVNRKRLKLQTILLYSESVIGNHGWAFGGWRHLAFLMPPSNRNSTFTIVDRKTPLITGKNEKLIILRTKPP